MQPKDPVAGLKEALRQTSRYMNITAILVNYINGRHAENATHYTNLDHHELNKVAALLAAVAQQAQEALDLRVAKKLPAEWQEDQIFDRVVTTPYGWTHADETHSAYQNQAWSVPVTLDEFEIRMDMSSSAPKNSVAARFAYKED